MQRLNIKINVSETVTREYKHIVKENVRADVSKIVQVVTCMVLKTHEGIYWYEP